MGLSGEERLSKFYNYASGWRQRLCELEKLTFELRRPIVRGWIRRLDDIVGSKIVQTDRNGLQWLMGPNEDNFFSLWSNAYSAARIDESDKIVTHDDSIEGYGHITLLKLARRLKGHEVAEDEPLEVIGAFWDQWGYVSWLLYPMLRYKDGLFAKQVAPLRRLAGEMASRRLELGVQHYGDPIPPAVVDDLYRLEHCFLVKARYVHVLLEQADRAFQKVLDKRLNKIPRGPKRRDKYLEARRQEPWDEGKDIIRKVAAMPIWKVVKAIEAHEREEWERKREEWERKNKARQKGAREEGPEKFSGALGPEPRSSEELEKIIETGTVKSEVREAADELNAVYSTSIGGWEQRFKKKKR